MTCVNNQRSKSGSRLMCCVPQGLLHAKDVARFLGRGVAACRETPGKMTRPLPLLLCAFVRVFQPLRYLVSLKADAPTKTGVLGGVFAGIGLPTIGSLAGCCSSVIINPCFIAMCGLEYPSQGRSPHFEQLEHGPHDPHFKDWQSGRLQAFGGHFLQ